MKKIKRILSLLISVAVLNIPQIIANADNAQIYFTDFDSYIINGAVTNQTFTGFSQGSYGNLNAAANGDGVTGIVLDSKRGTSMKFDGGDWRNLDIGFSERYNGKMLISYDFYMQSQGTIKMLGNNGNNFGMMFEGTNFKETIDLSKPVTKEDAINLEEWYKVETFVDTENDMQITYINGIQIGSIRPLEGEKTPFESFQIQKVGGGEMYIDNIEIKNVSAPPYLKELNASLKSDKINAESDTITINFDGAISKESVTSDTIKIYDETNKQYLDFVFNEIGSTSVTIIFNGALKKNCEYTVEFGSLTDMLGQSIKTKMLAFNTNITEISDRTPIISCDFDSYRIGTSKVIDKPFISLSNAYLNDMMRPNSNGDEIVGEVIDDNYGISMKMTAGDWRNLDIALMENLEDEFILSFDFRVTDVGTFRVLTNNGLGAQACIDGTSGKPESNNESTVEYITNVIKLKEWATVELYVNPKQQSFAFYINGKMIGDEHEFYGETSQIESIQFQKISGGDMYVDNLSIETVTGHPHIEPVRISLSLENNIMPEGEKSLYLQFSDMMDTSKITSDVITVSEIINTISTDVPFTLSEITSRRVKITLLDELKKEASYVINLGDTITGSSGNSLAVNHISFFPYSEVLRVNNVEFTDYNGNTNDDKEIPPEVKNCTIYFNAPLTGLEIDGNINFTDENNTVVPANIKYIDDKNAVRITPLQMLKGNSTYNLSISKEILETEYKKTFVTLAGSFAKGDITVNDEADKITGDFVPNDIVEVKADIINTVCEKQDYVVMVGEYANGKLVAYHFYNEVTEDNTTFSQKIYNVKLLLQADEIRAFVWKNPRTAQPVRRII